MKNSLVIFLLSITILAACYSAQSNNLIRTISTSGQMGEVSTIELQVENTAAFVAFQADISIPKGLNFVEGSVVLNPERTSGHSVNARIVDSKLRIIVWSGSNTAFSRNYGTLLTFQVKADMVSGNYLLSLSNTVLSDNLSKPIAHNLQNGTLSIVPPSPILSLNPSSLSFGNVEISTSSTVQSYTLTGSYLTGDVTVTAPSQFEVSLSSTSGWTSNLSITPVSGSVDRIIYVRFSPTSIGSKTGNLANTTAGATTQNVSVSGKGEEIAFFTILQIQGMTSVSSSVGMVRRTKGTVTGVLSGVGYFIQDAVDPWSGIWIDDPLTVVFEGNGIEIIGVVKELNGVTSIEGKGTIINPPIRINPISLFSPQQAFDEKYESVLVQLQGVRAKSINPNGTWLIYTEVNNTLVIGDWLFNYLPKAGNFYSITGIINGVHDLFRLEPRKEQDIIDLTLTDVPNNVKEVNSQVYPNPFETELVIKNFEKLSRFVITNILGHQVMDISYPQGRVSTTELPSGVYIISLLYENSVKKKQVLVKH